MSWIRIYIHAVFSTKNFEPLLNSIELRQKIFKHIKQNATEKGIWLDCVNGYNNHALPEDWTKSKSRLKKAGVPLERHNPQTKLELALAI
ncbi:MAG: hypothetical protein SGJ10_13200, partial [Bacteroidota bacterium]|nr:hypothetical protein [Bacteroidota bacterium]